MSPMAQVERDDMEEKMVAEEMRSGYLIHDKGLRPSLVAVSVRPKAADQLDDEDTAQEPKEKLTNGNSEEEY